MNSYNAGDSIIIGVEDTVERMCDSFREPRDPLNL